MAADIYYIKWAHVDVEEENAKHPALGDTMFDKGGGRGTASMGEKFLPAREVGSEKQKDGLSEARWRRKMGWEVVSKDAITSRCRKVNEEEKTDVTRVSSADEIVHYF